MQIYRWSENHGPRKMKRSPHDHAIRNIRWAHAGYVWPDDRLFERNKNVSERVQVAPGTSCAGRGGISNWRSAASSAAILRPRSFGQRQRAGLIPLRLIP